MIGPLASWFCHRSAHHSHICSACLKNRYYRSLFGPLVTSGSLVLDVPFAQSSRPDFPHSFISRSLSTRQFARTSDIPESFPPVSSLSLFSPSTHQKIGSHRSPTIVPENEGYDDCSVGFSGDDVSRASGGGKFVYHPLDATSSSCRRPRSRNCSVNLRERASELDPQLREQKSKESQTKIVGGAYYFTKSPALHGQHWTNFAAQTYFSGRSFSTAFEGCGPGKDHHPGTWIERSLPRSLWSFAYLARLDRPIGTWLLAWPCFWSISLAAPAGSCPDPKLICLFGVGAILLRGAGCTVNDLLDSDIDGQVERTRERPLASGILTTFQGIGFLGCQLLLGLGILLQLNNFSRVLGASSLLLVGTYPLMKRWTYWPQAFLGLTFNWGALLGWAAVHGDLDLAVVLPLYASGVGWTLVYDTIYAHQDKEDDVKVGVKSTALRFGDETKTWLAAFSAACVSGLTLAGINAELGWPFYVGVVTSAGHLAWQVYTVDINNRTDCNSKFVSNKWFGAIVCSAIVAGRMVT